MKVIDISGPIFNGMWSYGEQYPKYKLETIDYPYEKEVYPVDVFEGFHAQTGTYIESPGICKDQKIKKLNDMHLKNFYKIDTFVFQIPYNKLSIKDGKPYISLENIKEAEKQNIPKGSSILISTGYGENWKNDDYLDRTWFFKKEAIYYLIDKKPFLIGGDSPIWENDLNPEGALPRLYEEGILLLAPCVNLEEVEKFKVKLIVLPLKVSEAATCPVRAAIIED